MPDKMDKLDSLLKGLTRLVFKFLLFQFYSWSSEFFIIVFVCRELIVSFVLTFKCFEIKYIFNLLPVSS